VTALVAGAEPSGPDLLLQGVRQRRGGWPQSTGKSLIGWHSRPAHPLP